MRTVRTARIPGYVTLTPTQRKRMARHDATGHRMSELYLGLMSGTSLDGIDAAVVDLSTRTPRVIAAHTQPYAAGLRNELLALAHGGSAEEIELLGRLDRHLGELFAEAALSVLRQHDLTPGSIQAIGSHGQTVRHRPAGPAPFTLQIADPNLIAERTGITTVADFRRRDMAAGGQGAPLVPAFHASCFRNTDADRAVLNLGGMANLTLLPADPQQAVRGFDTGPGNVLLDAWIGIQMGEICDRDGAWAASGQAQPALLQQLLQDEYFHAPPPKSTGREQFNLAWLEPRLAGYDCQPQDVQATLVALTAETVAMGLRDIAPRTRRMLVCGGGAHNAALMAALNAHLPDVKIESTAEHGLDPDWIEAAAFAWMARETLAGRPSNVPDVTGARGPRILGGIYPA